MYRSTSLVLAPLLLQGVKGWGNLGHETVGYIASAFVQPATQTWAQNILGDTSSDYLANVATWADSYRYTSEGRFSAPFHFIDAEDSPPNSCNVDYDRDCADGNCIVAALTNYTRRVQSTSLSSDEVFKALKWIIHFTGDATQPLHDEAYEVGGNDVSVTYNGKSSNLHHIWDTEMPVEQQGNGGSGLDVANTWAQNLVNQINNGQYASQAASWVANMNINDPKSTALGWAQDANAYVCSTVAPNGFDVLQQNDLATNGYYDNVIPTIDLQIAKGGYRLAKWLDLIAANAGSSSKVKREGPIDLSGRDLLPPSRMPSPQRLRRMVVGYGCQHDH